MEVARRNGAGVSCCDLDKSFGLSLGDLPDLPWPYDGVQRREGVPSSARLAPDGFAARWEQSWYPLDDVAPCFDTNFASKTALGAARDTKDPFGWLSGPYRDPLPTNAHLEGYPAACLDELRWSEGRT